MGIVWAICRRDLLQAFTTPLAWLILAAWSLVTNFAFCLTLTLVGPGGRSDIALYYWSFVTAALALLLLAPAITMNAFAQERERGTMQLLLALPIRDLQVVVGKFLAAFLLLASLILVTAVQPAALWWISEVPPGQLASAWLGLLLMAAFMAGLGVWIGSLLDSTVACYVITMAVAAVLFLGGWVLGDPATGIWPPAGRVAAFVSIEDRLTPLLRGDLSLADPLWFVLASTLFILLAHAGVQARRIHD